MSDIWSAIGHQLKCPAGPPGRVAGRIMSVVNKQPNHLAIRALSLQPRDTVLELGFGPGGAIKSMAALVPQGLVLGTRSVAGYAGSRVPSQPLGNRAGKGAAAPWELLLAAVASGFD